MLTNEVTIYEFKPLWLTVDKIGPFQEQFYEVDFTDDQDRPCNIFLLMSENGRGKTTVLDLMACLMNLLGSKQPNRFGHEDLDRGQGRVQWDLWVRLNWQGKDRTVILSLLAGNLGEDISLRIWAGNDLQKFEATSWHRTGFRHRAPGRLEAIGQSDELVEDLLATLHEWHDASPVGFEENDLDLPTVLYFNAYRDIPPIEGQERAIVEPEQWGYRPMHYFGAQGNRWTDSLDNLLVWLVWLNDGRFERARDIVNNRVFEGQTKAIREVRRHPPEAILINDGNEHRLDRLSSGEKNLVQLFLRIGAHMTRNTIILIDEVDVHLHIKWQHRVLRHLKSLVRDNPGITVIAATHSIEILEAFPIDIEEEGLIKGGWLFEEKLK